MGNTPFHPEAGTEYVDAIDWYWARSPRTAARFEAEVERVLGLIESQPDSFPQYDADHRFAVLHRFPYSLVDQVRAGQVYVVAVAHARRAAGYWSGRS